MFILARSLSKHFFTLGINPLRGTISYIIKLFVCYEKKIDVTIFPALIKLSNRSLTQLSTAEDQTDLGLVSLTAEIVDVDLTFMSAH